MRPRSAAVAVAVLTALVAATPAAARPYGFLATPTDQLAVPGDVAGFEVTPEGFIYGGYGELVFRAGPKLVGLRAPVRTLEGGRYPVLRYGQRFGGARYDLDVFAAEVAGQPVAFVRVTLRNTSARPLRARWAVGVRYSGGALKANGVRRFRYPRPIVPERPGLITQPGIAFALGWDYAFGDGTLVRDGQVLATVAPAPPGAEVELQRRDGAGAITPSTTFDLVEYGIRLAPGERRVLDFRMPSEPVADGSPAAIALRTASHVAQRTALLRTWRATFDRAMSLQLPERRVQERVLREPHPHPPAALQAARRHLGAAGQQAALPRLLAARRRDHDAGARPRRPARRGRARTSRSSRDWQRDDGQFISREGQLDGLGQALWATRRARPAHGRHAPSPARMLPRLDRAVAWLHDVRLQDPLGIVPASDPRDNELVAGHLAGDDFWAVAGLAAIADAARLLGDGARAAALAPWSATRSRSPSARGSRIAAARNGGAIPSALDHSGGLDWGNLWAAWPAPVLDPPAPHRHRDARPRAP